jgi:hypothetical protein
MEREEKPPMLSTHRFAVLVGATAFGVAASLLAACTSGRPRSDQLIAHADVSGLIGNTVVEYDRQNPAFVVKVQLYADGTYRTWVSVGFKPITTTGTWREQGGKLCYTQSSKPIPGTPTYFCAHGMDGKNVGDTWIERWPDGRMFKAQVLAGSS